MAKKKSAPKKQKVLWAVDAFSRDHETQIHVAKALKAFMGAKPHTVLPTYVLDFIAGANDLRVTPKLERSWKSEFVPLAEKELDSIVEKAHISNADESTVLIHGTTSRRQSVDFLIKTAKKEKVEVIALGTHARQGLSRLFLGSFAETLVTSSEVPVLAVNPNAQVSDKVKKILFPTDFSKKSAAGYETVVKKASELGASIILFHKYFSPVEPIIQNGVYMLGGGWVPTAQFIESEEKSKKTLADKWIKTAEKKGVKVEFVTSHPDLAISAAVCDAAKTYNADLIAIVNQTGRWSTVLLGSVSREVLRDANVPVWVMHL